MNKIALAIAVAGVALTQFSPAHAQQSSYAGMAAMHAAANGVPASLVHRVIMRESRYNARAVSKGNYGIMQIRLGTARSMGYTGSAAGLLDPNTNMTYAVKYLAGAYRAAGGNESRAVSLYASGYYSHARRASNTQVTRREQRQQAAAGYAWFQPSYRSAYESRRVRRQQVAASYNLFRANYASTYQSRSARRYRTATSYRRYQPSYGYAYASRTPRYARRAVTRWQNPLTALFSTKRPRHGVRYARSHWRQYN